MKLLNNKSWLWWLLLIATIPAYVTILREGFFPMHDDLPVVRQYAMEECVRDLQIPCRWTKELGYGYGYPLMNFYPPLPYIVGLLSRAMGLSYLDTIKFLFAISFILATGFMARLGQVFFGRWGGVVAAIFYLYGPYRALDLYVRGDLNELWATVFLPAAVWYGYKLVRRPSVVGAVALGLSVAMIVMSHLGMTLIMAPVVVVWILMWLVLHGVERVKKAILPLAVSTMVALGVSSFFIVPVVFEQQYVHVETLTIGYFNFLAHFINLNQLFLSRFWGYGSSVYGPNDGMSFQVGVGHWLVGLVALLGILFWREKGRMRLAVMIFCMFLFLGSAFMAHWKATPIWLRVPKLEFLQFPWRLLSLISFAVSLVAGGVVWLFKERWRWLVAAMALALNLILYEPYFQPLRWFGDRIDAKQFSGEIWQREITAGIFDYLPRWSKTPPKDPAPSDATLAGRLPVTARNKKSNAQTYVVDNRAAKSLPLVVNTFYYPGWSATVDGRQVKIESASGDLGLMTVLVPPGVNDVTLIFKETGLRMVADLVSFASLVVIAGYVVWRRRWADGAKV